MAEVRVAMHLTRSYLYFTCAFVLRILCFYFNYIVSCFSGCTTWPWLFIPAICRISDWLLFGCKYQNIFFLIISIWKNGDFIENGHVENFIIKLFVTTFNYVFNGFYNVYKNIIHFKNNNKPSLISLKLLKHVNIKYNAYFKRIRGESQRYRKADEGPSRQQAVVLEQQWRITASRFGEISRITPRRQIRNLCEFIACPKVLNSSAVYHGKMYEQKAIKQFEEKFRIKTQKCGLFVPFDRPYLGASPDAIFGDEGIVEVKCPYAGKNMPILPGPIFRH